MFEFYNLAEEMIFIFQNGRLIFANESALHFLQSYFHVIEGKTYDCFFQTPPTEGEQDLHFVNGAVVRCECTPFTNDGETFLLIHQVAQKKEQEIQITTPKTLYDPHMLGRRAVQASSLADSIQTILSSVKHLMKTEGIQLKMKEELQVISQKADEIYRKTNDMLEEYETLHLDMLFSYFDMREVVQNICQQMEEYIQLEKLAVSLTCSAREGSCLVLADQQQVARALTGLISNLLRYLDAYERKGKLNIKVYAVKDQVEIVMEDNGKRSEDMLERLTYNDVTSIPSQDILTMQVIHSLLEKNKGALYMESHSGVGVRYIVRFPLTTRSGFCEKEREVDYRTIVFEEMRRLFS